MGKIGQREAIRFLAARARQKREARRLARRERSEPVQTQTDDRPRWQAAFFEELRAVEVSGGSLRDLMEAQREFYRDAVSWLEGGLVALEHDLDPEKAAAVRMVQDSQRPLLPRVELLAVELLKERNLATEHRRKKSSVAGGLMLPSPEKVVSSNVASPSPSPSPERKA